MLNTYRYATAEELRVRALSKLTPEDKAILSRTTYRFDSSDRLDAANSHKLHAGAQRRSLTLVAFVTRKEARNRELYG
jgi:hypothetical protein